MAKAMTLAQIVRSYENRTGMEEQILGLSYNVGFVVLLAAILTNLCRGFV
jgi:hypothetical protein